MIRWQTQRSSFPLTEPLRDMPHRYILLIASLFILLPGLLTAPAHGQARGSIVGQVTDANSEQPLPGANVVVEGTTIGTATDADGRYRLPELSAGTVQLVVSYIGYAEQTVSVTVSGGETARQNIALQPMSFTGEEVVVLGVRAQGQAKALSQQKNAANITNVVAADQIGRFPDASAPDALQRVPGIGVQRDQGEGRFIQIRGGAPQLTTVTFNGERIPSPEGDVRQIALDAVPTDILQSIEVSKAITPDMDADAVGGAVNLVTRRAPERSTFSVEGAGGYGNIRQQGSLKSSLTYGTRTADNRLGVLINGSINRRNFGSDNFEPEYDLGADDQPLGGDDSLDEHQVRLYDVMRQRIGLNGVVDYRISDQSSVYLRSIFTQLQDTEQRNRLVSAVGDGELEYQHKNRTEYLRTLNLTAGGEHAFASGLQLEARATYTRSQEETPEDVEITWLQEGVAFSPDLSDPNLIQANPSASALSNAQNFGFDAVEPSESNTTNDDYIGALDFTYPYRLGAVNGTVQFGGKYRYKDKVQDVAESELGLIDSASPIRLGDGNGVAFSDYYRGDFETGRFDFPPVITSNDEVLDFPTRFGDVLETDAETALEGDLEDFDAQEVTYAGYLMSELNLTDRFLLLPGVRYEHTAVDSEGFQAVVTSDGDLTGRQAAAASNDYGYFFPMLHARYQVAPNTNLRAAVTTALARPNFFDLAPYRIADDEEAEIGNPDLIPSRSVNLDLFAEHYTESIGVFSAGAFYKTINDPIITTTFVPNAGLNEGLNVFQSSNGQDGTIWGLEFAAQQQLQFLPGVLGGLGIYANYTYTQSEITLANGSTGDFPGQADHVFNAAISYERSGFSGQLSLNYTGDFLDEFAGDGASANRANDVFVDQRWGLDFSGSYQIGTSGFSAYMELVNLLNEPLVLYQGNESRPRQVEYYEPWGWVGVKYNL